MSSVVSFLKGQAGLSDEAMGAIQGIVAASAMSIREEVRPMRELMAGLMVQNEKLTKALETISASVSQLKTNDLPQLKPLPVAKGVRGLDFEKKASEIISMLYEKMADPHPARLRPFYTDLEADTGVYITSKHRERTSEIKRGDEGKYPYRKMDTALMYLDPDFVFQYAKSYKFSIK
ncbi:hypothetical protein [Paenibacillus campinasensis]|uniref:Uncharacterized protein n=1 Tax=Paenibacillus campinasensis TaxID=66347 RepID=A0A268EGY9_9BACL|nr:hypothetical protein [Paenibacillus campinasensis]PAD72390.1 hypothetical protein CHH67_22375 [Paenibacillus campinasensis]